MENRSPPKRKSRFGLNVGDAGGIGGVVLLGGSLAVAGLLAAFTIIKNKNGRQDGKNEDPITPSNQKTDGVGLSFVIQSPSKTVQHKNSCRMSHEPSKVAIAVPIDSCELGDKPVMITDDKEENPSSHHQEISISDYSEEESTASSLEILSTEVALLPASDVPPLDTPENMIKDEFSENLQLIETTEAKKGDEPIVAEKLAVEENPVTLSVDEEEEENDDDSATEHVVEKEEENENDSTTKQVEEENEDRSGTKNMKEGDDDNTTRHVTEKEENDADLAAEQVREKEEIDDDCITEQVIEKEENYNDITTDHVVEKEESSEGISALEENSPVQSVEKKDDEDVEKENQSLETENLAPEENLPILSGLDEEEQEDEREENVTEKEEESSEGEPLVEENSPMQSTEEEDDEDDDNYNFSMEEHVMGKEERSSDGTGCSSMESNVKAIWPSEMIDAFSKELKAMNVSNPNSGEKIAKPVKLGALDFKSGGNTFNEVENDGTTENSKTILHKKATWELSMANAQTAHLPSSRRRIWVWSLLMVALLVLLFRIHQTARLDLTHPDYVMVP